jgi:hypothetical protein
MNNPRLVARVNAKNRANAIAHRIEREIREIFRPYIGKKVLLNGGGLIAPLRKQLDQYDWPQQKEYRFYRNNLKYTFSFEVSVSEPIHGDTGIFTARAYVAVGSLDGENTLESISPETGLPPQQYTAEEIEQLRIDARKKEGELNKIKNKFACFGEYDNCEVQP